MSSVNLYNVLSVPENCDKKTIKSAYRKLVKKYHPDKGGDVDLYELITHAYNVLSDEAARRDYDIAMQVTQEAEHDFEALQAGFQQFVQAQGNGSISKGEAHRNFSEISAELDNQHGYVREEHQNDEISEDQACLRMGDLIMAREQEDIENTQDQLFDPDDFNQGKFNATWDRVHRQSASSQLIKHEGNPLPWNGSMDANSSVSHGVLYDETDEFVYGDSYASIETTKKMRKITREDVIKMQGAEYTDNHTANNSNSEYKSLLDQRIEERKAETNKYSDMSFEEFNTDETMEGYGITHQIGLGTSSSRVWENDDAVREQYQKMLMHRKKEESGEQMTKEEKKELRRQARDKKKQNNSSE